MKSRNGFRHWLFAGLALLGSANVANGQAGSPYYSGAAYGGAPGSAMPGYPGGAMPGSSMYGMGNHGPMSIAMPGPPPGELAYQTGPSPIGGPAMIPNAGQMPNGPMPGGPMPGGAMPGGAMPGGAMPGGAMPGGAMPGGAMPGGAMSGAGPMSGPVPGHPPGCACCSGAIDAGGYLQGGYSEGGGLCTGCGGTGCLFCSGAGCEYCGGAKGCRLCGTFGGRLGCAPVRNMLRSTGIGRHRVGADGCMACGWGNNALLPGRCLGLLGRLAPFSEGPQAQRWFDFHLGTMALNRTDDSPTTIISTEGISGTPVLSYNDPNIDKLEFGLTATAALQLSAGANLEVTYFGLNKWDSTASAVSATGDLYSVFSDFGVSPPGGFDDTDRSTSHSLRYESAIHNGELNYRRRWVAPARWIQGSWLGGIRYFDLDERFGFQSIGNNGVGGTQSFFNLDTQARNELAGFQLGSDLWTTLVPGVMFGIEGKYGVFGNHAEVDSIIQANSVPLSREELTDGQTAYLGELALHGVYRISYSWAFRASYNYLRVDNVALAPRNFNTEGLTPDVNGLVFGAPRAPFIDVNGVARYSGFSLGAEYLW